MKIGVDKRCVGRDRQDVLAVAVVLVEWKIRCRGRGRDKAGAQAWTDTW